LIAGASWLAFLKRKPEELLLFICPQHAIGMHRSQIFVYPSSVEPLIRSAIPVLPAADATASLNWWIEVCGFKEAFRDGTPPRYVGITRGGAHLHIAEMSNKDLARQVGDQTMVRLVVTDVEAFYVEYQQRGGKVHPQGQLQTKPWGTKEFSAIDPTGVCVTFLE
jgi:uncharacterized glyoxalase superfamily protein PhnB